MPRSTDMGKKPYPELLLPDIYSLTPELLQAKGIRLLLLDLDNTITKYGVTVPTARLSAYIADLRAAGIEPFIYSNSHGDRAALMAEALDVGYMSHVKKPHTEKLDGLLAEKGVSKAETAIAGDQIYRDVLCGVKGGILSVCVRPISLKNPFRALRYLAELPYRRVRRDDNSSL